MKAKVSVLVLAALVVAAPCAFGHAINYRVENQGISARIFFAGDTPMRYANYELFGPGDTIVFQKGRSDRNGVVSFLPDRPGTWQLKVSGEEAHGPHGTEFTMEVNNGLDLASFHQPLVAQYTKAFIGMSLIMFIFSLWALFKNYRKSRQKKID